MSQASTRVDTHTNTHALASDHQKNAGIIIIGAGMAGSRFAIELARTQSNDDTARLPITLISKEPQVGYNRIMLSPVLAGDTAFEDTYLYDNSEYEQLGITVLAGVAVETIDTKCQCIELDDGQTLNYVKLVMATGSTARVIPFPNHTAKGVHVFRDLADVTALMDYASQGKTGLVIGGGVLGLEAACALAAQGASMTVIHMDVYVLNRQLDLPAAELLQAELSRRGVGLAVSAHTEAIEMNDAGEVCGLSLKDGRTLAADFIVMAVGVIPNTALAKQSGIEVNRGIVVDDFMHTSCPNVYAIGECIEREGELFGMVAPVNQQVDTLVTVLKDGLILGNSTSSNLASKDLIENDTNVIDGQITVPDHWVPFVSKPLSLKLKVSGMSTFSAGQIAFDDEAADTVETLVYRQPELNHYHCLYLKENKLIGAVLYGDTSDGSFYSQLIIDNVDITSIKDTLIFGEAYCHLDEITLNNSPTREVNIEFNDTDKNINHHKAAELLEDAL